MFMIDLNPRAGVEEWRGLSDWLDVCLLLDLCLNKSSACWSEFERVASGFSLNIYIMLKLFRDSLWPPYERLAFWFGLHIPGSSAGVNVKWFLEMEEASYPSIPTFKLAVIIYSSFIWYDIHLVEFRIFVLLFVLASEHHCLWRSQWKKQLLPCWSAGSDWDWKTARDFETHRVQFPNTNSHAIHYIIIN